jgi:hypothetical protein
MNHKNNLPHWNYFRVIEQDLEACFRYVAPTPVHYSVHSDEFGKIILVACSEIENALQALASDIDPTAKLNNICDFSNVILSKFPRFVLAKVEAARYSLVVEPWKNWNSAAPDWWKNGYNKIKHDRAGNPEAATFERALNAVAALEIVLLYLYQHKYQVNTFPIRNCPHMLEPVPEEGGIEGAFIGWNWELP